MPGPTPVVTVAPGAAGIRIVVATGQRDGQPEEVSVTVSHPNEYQATGLVVAAYVTQWSDGPGTPARTPAAGPGPPRDATAPPA